MFNSIALDVVIGLVFIYLLYSLLATIVQEIIATKLSFRAKVLEKAIMRMLEDGKSTTNLKVMDRVSGFWHLLAGPNMLMDKKVASWFYAHPLIKYLGEDNFFSKPAYISSQNFSKVMIDLLKGFESTPANEVQQLADSISNGVIYRLPIDLDADKNNPAIAAIRSQLPQGLQDGVVKNTIELNKDTKLFLKSIWLESGADVEKFKQKLEQWFDDTMERAGGWYKRYVKLVLFCIGLLIAVGFNVDTVSITKKLAHDPKLREQMVQSAGSYIEKNKALGEQLGKMQVGSKVYNNLQANSDSLTRISNALLDSAKNMINTDIKNVNDIMGLGWSGRADGKGFPYLQKGQGPVTCYFGWLITALAISLGAPFWFDLLNKLMKVRGAGGKGDAASKTDDASAAKQAGAPAISVNVNTQTGEEAVG